MLDRHRTRSLLDLAARGFQVFAGVRKESDGNGPRQSHRATLRSVLVDVTDADQVRQAAAAVERRWASRAFWDWSTTPESSSWRRLEPVALDQLRRQFEAVNVFGTLARPRRSCPHPAAAGRIVLIGSIAGLARLLIWGTGTLCGLEVRLLERSPTPLRMEPEAGNSPSRLSRPTTWPRRSGQATTPAARIGPMRLLKCKSATKTFWRCGKPPRQWIAPACRPASVVRVIRHALTANRPKTRYPVGFRTRLAWAASRILDGIHDWYMLRELGLAKAEPRLQAVEKQHGLRGRPANCTSTRSDLCRLQAGHAQARLHLRRST